MMGSYNVNHMKFRTEILIKNKWAHSQRENTPNLHSLFNSPWGRIILLPIFNWNTHRMHRHKRRYQYVWKGEKSHFSQTTFNLFCVNTALLVTCGEAVATLSLPIASTSGSMQFPEHFAADVCLQYLLWGNKKWVQFTSTIHSPIRSSIDSVMEA